MLMKAPLKYYLKIVQKLCTALGVRCDSFPFIRVGLKAASIDNTYSYSTNTEDTRPSPPRQLQMMNDYLLLDFTYGIQTTKLHSLPDKSCHS